MSMIDGAGIASKWLEGRKNPDPEGKEIEEDADIHSQIHRAIMARQYPEAKALIEKHMDSEMSEDADNSSKALVGKDWE